MDVNLSDLFSQSVIKNFYEEKILDVIGKNYYKSDEKVELILKLKNIK
jgi:hypothetical protein